MSAEFDPLDDPHWQVREDATSPSGGVSAGQDLVTGQATPSSGTQAWFKDAKGTPLAKAYTVRFGVTPPTMGVTERDNIFDCVATVTSTVQGNSVTRVFNVGQGTAITGEAESVTVSLDDITSNHGQSVVQPDGSVGTFNNPYRIAVVIAPGIRPNYTIPPTLEAFATAANGAPLDPPQARAITVASGQSVFYPIPKNTGVSSVEIVVTLGGPPIVPSTSPVVALFTEGLGSFKQYDPTLVQGFVSVPPNATALLVENATTGNLVVTVTWGIEG